MVSAHPKSSDDVSNFDVEFTHEVPKLTPIDRLFLMNIDQTELISAQTRRCRAIDDAILPAYLRWFSKCYSEHNASRKYRLAEKIDRVLHFGNLVQRAKSGAVWGRKHVQLRLECCYSTRDFSSVSTETLNKDIASPQYVRADLLTHLRNSRRTNEGAA
ncbi:hypothetical protein KIN20_000221 [Parelaphostrongylus tenuis]|uniref:Protein kinase C-terminal domain-containing protein n=1 Tax=Parelaphostrongylus tenuis TaxID=148309 RepID=A0AAD5QBC2_PARTN|nr:hypothetical protein KIN20_000221 [Parelaphostrongylus tenuis]